MSLENWVKIGWANELMSSKDEIMNLLNIVNRDLKDAEADISPDWKFGIAYNAVLKLCTVLVRANDIRVERNSHHYKTIQAFGIPKHEKHHYT